MEMVIRNYPNDWVKNSVMYRNGVSNGSSGKSHNLTKKEQGDYHYTIGPYSNPVLEIDPGDQVVVETADAFEGKIKSESDKPTEKLKMPWLNPQCGPIVIKGAEKGDTLAVHIEKMIPIKGFATFHPLKHCIVGRGADPASVAEPLKQIMRTTAEDLNNLVNTLEEMGVVCYRPNIETAGEASIWMRSGTKFSRKCLFNAQVPTLEEFRAKPEFIF